MECSKLFDKLNDEAWDDSARIDASIDELLLHPIDLRNAFSIRTASGDSTPASLCGLSERRTYHKSYHNLKNRLQLEHTKVLYPRPFEKSAEHEKKLDSTIASLSDAQFDVFFKVLASSPDSRHRMYLGICAMLPRDLEALQKEQTDRLSWKSDLAAQHPSQWAFPPSLQQHNSDASTAFPNEMLQFQPQENWNAVAFPQPLQPHDPDAETSNVINETPPQARPRESWNTVDLSFSIDDVDGAAGLLLQIALNMEEAGFDPNVSNVELLQRFASLCDTVSNQLVVKWLSKWPLVWDGIDEFTLDLENAYGPDGCYLPTERWLKMLNSYRNATPPVFKVKAPTKELTREAYVAFGLGFFVN